MSHLRILLRIKGTWIRFSGHGRTWQKSILGNILNYFGGAREKFNFFSREQGNMYTPREDLLKSIRRV